MNANVGTVGWIVRLVVGVALIAVTLFNGMAFFDGEVVKYGAVIVGLVLVLTGLMRTCPLFHFRRPDL